MPSRFPVHITFTDYDVDELLEIANIMAKNKEYELSKEAIEKLRRRLVATLHDPFRENFSNARFVRNNIEKAIRVQAVRMLRITEPTREDLVTLKYEDFAL